MQVSPDDNLLRIVQDSGTQLVAEQASGSISFPLHVLTFAAFLALLYFLWNKRWGLGLIPLCLVVLFTMLNRPGPLRRISLDRAGGEISWQTNSSGKPGKVSAIHVSELATANVEFRAAGGRVVLVRRDGTQEMPLGSTFIANEPVQFILVKDIQEMIEQSSGSGRKHAP